MRLVSVARWSGSLLAVVALAVVGVVVPAAPARADDSFGIAVAPVDAQGHTDGRSRFSYKVAPGKVVNDQVRVTNVGTAPLKVSVYAADAYNNEKGDFALRPSGEKATGAASWTTFEGKDRYELTLAGGASKVVPFRVVVPADATPGDHVAGVIASAKTSGQVTVDQRIADRLYVRVSGALQPILTVSNMSAAYHGGWNPLEGSVLVSATLNNTGNVALGGAITVSGTTWFGLGVGRLVREDAAEVLPGNTAPASIELTGVPAVGYLISSLLLQSSITGDAPDPGPLPVIHRDAFTLALPWLVVALIVVGVGFILLLRWRRTVNEQRAAEWDAYHQASAADPTEESTDPSGRRAAAAEANRGAQ